jgi:hypothetical protein
VHADNCKSLDDTGVKILKELSGNRFLIETERYDGFKTTLFETNRWKRDLH